MSNNYIYEKAVKDAMMAGKPYLARNDIYGFYYYISRDFMDKLPDKIGLDIFGWLTEAFDKCGVDTMSYFGKKIPRFYCCGGTVPNRYYKRITEFKFNNISALSFPDNIKWIEPYAFTKSHFDYALDLRGIEFVEEGAFSYTSEIFNLIIDENIRLSKAVFSHTVVGTIWYDGDPEQINWGQWKDAIDADRWDIVQVKNIKTDEYYGLLSDL